MVLVPKSQLLPWLYVRMYEEHERRVDVQRPEDDRKGNEQRSKRSEGLHDFTWRKVRKVAMGDGFVNQYTLDSFIATC